MPLSFHINDLHEESIKFNSWIGEIWSQSMLRCVRQERLFYGTLCLVIPYIYIYSLNFLVVETICMVLALFEKRKIEKLGELFLVVKIK